MKTNSKKHTLTKPDISGILALETAVPLLLSALTAYIAESFSLFVLLFLPFSAIALSFFRYIYSKSDTLSPLFKIHRSLPSSDILSESQSSAEYFKSMHNNARKSAYNFLCMLTPNGISSKSALQLYETITLFRGFLTQTNIFRIFSAALIFNSNHCNIMLSAAIPAALISVHICIKTDFSVESAVCTFITLPQRATVIFDGILRALGKFFLSKTFLYKWITKSQYAYLHSDKFVCISTYFWAFFLSFILVFSKNKILAISGLLFMLSPYCMIYYNIASPSRRFD